MGNQCFRLTVWRPISFTTKECACNGQLSDTVCTGYFAHTVTRSLTWKGFFGSVWGSHSSWQEVVSVAMWGDWPHCTCSQEAEREREKLVSAHFPFFYSTQTQVSGTMPPTAQVCLSISVRPLWKCPHIQRGSSSTDPKFHQLDNCD